VLLIWDDAITHRMGDGRGRREGSLDNLTERQVNALIKFANLIIFADSQDIKFILTAYRRTPEEQNALFIRGLSKCDGYIIRSKHQDRLAFDIVILNQEWKPINNYDYADEYQLLGIEWKRLGGRWGGEKDAFHFEVE